MASSDASSTHSAPNNIDVGEEEKVVKMRKASLATLRRVISASSPFSDKKANNKKITNVSQVSTGLREAYKKALLPVEEHSLFNEFHSPKMDYLSDFDACPVILLMGQYSTGKTSFIKYLMGQDYPGINIGPEPTTDKFTVICFGEENKIISGNAAVVDQTLPLRSLSQFGNAFLNRLQVCRANCSLLKGLTLVDTPGVLAGAKQSVDRGYDFSAVLTCFAEKVDRILLLFDAHKLDISDELRNVLIALRPFDEKLRVVLNKADSVEPAQLMRVHGALMWSLGKALNAPEVIKVHIGSFWERPLQNKTWKGIFEEDQTLLFNDLRMLPQMAAMRKLNDFTKRARLAKVHSMIINEMAINMPSFFYKNKKKNELIDKLDETYTTLCSQLNLAMGDFPNLTFMQTKLQAADWSRFRKMDLRKLDKLDKVINEDLSKLMSAVADTSITMEPDAKLSVSLGPMVFTDTVTPFQKKSGPLDSHIWTRDYQKGIWPVEQDNTRFMSWCDDFATLGPVDGKVTGDAAKAHMEKSGLPNATLSNIWTLSDVDQDQMLTRNEFALAMYLIELASKGDGLPATLPHFLQPPMV